MNAASAQSRAQHPARGAPHSKPVTIARDGPDEFETNKKIAEKLLIMTVSLPNTCGRGVLLNCVRCGKCKNSCAGSA